MIRLQFITILWSFANCSSTSHGIKLAKFSYNNRFYNTLIVDRIPDYGDGHAEGCLVQGQLFLSLRSINNSEIHGVVRGIDTLEPVPDAVVFIWFKGRAGPSSIVADAKGRFSFIREAKVSKLEINVFGWRGLIIDLEKKAIL